MSPITPADITGLVLAGGRGSRMGGVDKGLQLHRGEPLALHALRRLAPQVGRVALNANRHLADYAALGAALGAPVWPDALPGQPGPLAGFLTGLAHCQTPWLVTVPCDTPGFPDDLVARLAAGLAAEDAEIAIAASHGDDGQVQPQPVFCLLPARLHDGLAQAVAAGTRSIERWARQQRCAQVLFDDGEAAFFNANTVADLRRLQPARPPAAG